MQSPHDFLFSQFFNAATTNVIGNLLEQNSSGSPAPPIEDDFLLLDGSNFLLLDGTHLLLL